ncbi:MAG: hypothetical protein HXX19_04865 [Rhodoferax sp.]|nr:hypothetical protein [Rhodoferax sp.]
MHIPPFRFPRSIRLGAAMAAMLLQACVFTPRTVSFDDPNCQGVKREMVLDARVLEAYKSCSHEACRGDDVLLGVIGSTATFIVSGSMYVVGNVAYWIERQMNCKPA